MSRFLKTDLEPLPLPQLQPQQDEEGVVDFTKPWEHSDIVFIVEGRRVFANKMILSMNSPVMKAMFQSDSRERQAKEIKLPGKSLGAFVDLMKAVHPPAELKEKNFEKLLPLAHEYQMKHLLSVIEKSLLLDPPSLSQLVLADMYGLTKLRAACLVYAKRERLESLQQDELYNRVEPASKVHILEHHAATLTNEKAGLGLRVMTLSDSNRKLEAELDRLKTDSSQI